MKKILAWLLAIALTATVSIGATLAYLTDTDEDVNVMTLGNVKIDQLEYERIDTEADGEDAEVQEFHDNKPLLPGVYEDSFDFGTNDSVVDWDQIGKDGYSSGIWNPDSINNEVDKMVFVKNKGKSDAYVRTVFAFEAGNYADVDTFLSMVHLNLNETDWTWEWADTPVQIGESTYFVATATYNEVLAPGAYTEISLSQIALDKTATNEDVEAFGDTYQVLVKSQAIQADGFDSAALALDEGFGVMFTNLGTEDAPVLEVNADAMPFANDNPIEGIDVRTALHYLNGDAAGTQITASISNVVFGLNENYSEIVDHYDGVLVDVEQDVPVHSYYVKNGSTYTVYFLANDAIYCPKDSNKLFASMTQLVAVDTANLDVSRTESMRNMFRESSNLKTLDTSHWDTSSVTDMGYMFRMCSSLTNLAVDNFDTSNVVNMTSMFHSCMKLQYVDVSKWDTGNVTDMSYMFNTCESLTEIPLDHFDTSKVTSLRTMFQNCKKLKTVNVASWDTGNVTDMAYMFNGCTNLTEVPLENFDTSKVTGFKTMFQGCSSLKKLDVTNWDVSSVVEMQYMFNGCKSLTELKGIGNWTTSSVTTLLNTFSGCTILPELDVGSWDVSKVETMSQTFYGCEGLTRLDIGGWDTGNVKQFNSMFSSGDSNTGAMKLVELDLNGWDMSSATTLAWMFYGCGSLKTMDISNWDVSNVTTMYHLFADCRQLESVNFGDWDTSSLTIMDGMFNDCRSLVSLDLSGFDTENVVDISQLFESCSSLQEIKGLEYWNISKITDFNQTFWNCGSLETVDLSSFQTSNVTSTSDMFMSCGKLKTVFVGDGWDMSKVTNSGNMFGGCASLVGGNGTTFDSSKTDITYACVDAEGTPGYLTYKAAETP